ncbi:hypothetical protein G6L37_03250 [Agrobacterium rubi]|nr:hypothetical protein [Agrobacterium rubi]NTF24392.1 hypothetical protein [Agrobacterium rubi]
MTTFLDTTQTVLGFPVAKLKALLTSWDRTGKDYYDLSRLAGVSVSYGATAALIGEAWRLGLIGFTDADRSEWDTEPRLGLTLGGAALVTAVSRARTSKQKASVVVDQLLSNAQELMSDAKSPVKPDRIWIFGSYIDPEKDDVGDIDIVVESSRTNVVEYSGMLAYIRSNYPGFLPKLTGFDRYAPCGVFERRKLYGTRRHPLLAPNDIGTLERLHRPCALFFDAARGGIIEPEFHQYHPNSKERSSSIKERLVMPDLEGAARFELTNPIVLDERFSTAVSEKEFGSLNHQTREDGDSFLLRWSEPSDDGIVVTRTVDLFEDAWCCTYEVSADTVADKPHAAWRTLAEKLTVLAEADLLRLAVHRDDLGSMVEISIDIRLAEGCKSDHPLRHLLQSRTSYGSDILESKDYPAIPDSMAFGLFLLHEGTGSGLCCPCDLSDHDWDEARFPFTRYEYEEWADKHDVTPVP